MISANFCSEIFFSVGARRISSWNISLQTVRLETFFAFSVQYSYYIDLNEFIMSRRKALNCSSYFSLCCHFHKQVQVKLAFSLLEKGFIFKIFIDTFKKKVLGKICTIVLWSLLIYRQTFADLFISYLLFSLSAFLNERLLTKFICFIFNNLNTWIVIASLGLWCTQIAFAANLSYRYKL